MAKLQDQFANKAYATVTESAANTLTFKEIQTGLAMFEKVAWIIHRIQWYIPSATLDLLVAAGDLTKVALVGNNQMTSLDLGDQAVYDIAMIRTTLFGTPANAILSINPFIRDFSNLPGGGLIVPPRPIYVAIKSASLASAGTAEARIDFTYKALKAEEYWELVEATRIIE